HHLLVEAQPGCATRCLDVHFLVIEVRIACQQQPNVAAVDGHPGMTERMADQWNQQYVRRDALELSYAAEAEPAVALAGPVATPVLVRRPLLWTKALPVKPGFLLRRVLMFRSEHVHGGMWKIVETAGMVEIKVSQHDVPDLRRIETQAFDLPDGRHLFAKFRTEERKEKAAEPAVWVRDVLHPETSVDENQRIVRLEQQAVARQLGTADQ